MAILKQVTFEEGTPKGEHRMNERNGYGGDYNIGMSETMRAIYEHPGLDWDEINEARRNAPGSSKIQAIKNVREVTACGLKEAKDLVELVITYPVPRGWFASPQLKIAKLQKRIKDLEQENRNLVASQTSLTSANARVRIDADASVKRAQEITEQYRKRNAELVQTLEQEREGKEFMHALIKGANDEIGKQKEQIAQLINIVASLTKK